MKKHIQRGIKPKEKPLTLPQIKLAMEMARLDALRSQAKIMRLLVLKREREAETSRLTSVAKYNAGV